jgi:hypothetical protein
VALGGASALAASHLFVGRMRARRAWERSGALSLASGISVAYVFIHLLPSLGEEQRLWELARGGARLEWLDQQVYIGALIGLIVADGINRLARSGAHHLARYWVQVGALVIYNLLIGYYGVRLWNPAAMVMATVAFGAHFAVHDHDLDEEPGNLHVRYGRRILAAAVMLGWLLGSTLRLRATTLILAFSVVAGGILLRSLRDELDASREARFGAFVIGALAYSGLLIAMFYAIRR